MSYLSDNILINFHGASPLNALFRYVFHLPSVQEHEMNQEIPAIIFLFDAFQLKNNVFSHSNSRRHSAIADANADVNLAFADAKVLTVL